MQHCEPRGTIHQTFPIAFCDVCPHIKLVQGGDMPRYEYEVLQNINNFLYQPYLSSDTTETTNSEASNRYGIPEVTLCALGKCNC